MTRTNAVFSTLGLTIVTLIIAVIYSPSNATAEQAASWFLCWALIDAIGMAIFLTAARTSEKPAHPIIFDPHRILRSDLHVATLAANPEMDDVAAYAKQVGRTIFIIALEIKIDAAIIRTPCIVSVDCGNVLATYRRPGRIDQRLRGRFAWSNRFDEAKAALGIMNGIHQTP